ncbi:hypothetical protein A2W14_07330 [Candidatus Gottesmanbacteria bacterium RBG_16_37_8]|uniref:Single cache domain-containing protein n=1 Tax=Candidatus Gottesmanbacteria bacterium RBG_16_37_8 TaxID=1798371 RepID=A0A1F5YRR0_9BACT|nr:MAG: hypothetical protein A2W14_07330 [Candidatus Gottesmanbacteria bacterium RBG_16_37_8]
MWLQYFLEIAHFAIYLLTALVFFGVAWLYFDAARLKSRPKEILKFIGFFLLSIVYLLHASYIETILVPQPILGESGLVVLKSLNIFALFLIILGLFIDPLQDIPNRPSGKKITRLFIPLLLSAPFVLIISFAAPLLMVIIAFLYLRRATIGLENHLKTVSLSFYIFTISEFLNLKSLFTSSKNIDIYNLVSPFGPIWILQHLTLLIASVILLKWVFFYLFKRLETQLFFIYICSIISIFLLTAVTFTTLLVKNVENQAKVTLETNVKVLDYALKSKLNQTLSDAQIVSQNPETVTGLTDVTRLILKSLTKNILIAKKLDTLIISDQNGQILIRGEDSERFGDAISSDNLFKRTLLDGIVKGAVLKEGILAPSVLLKGASVIKDETAKVLGVVIAGISIDNAFVDGIKSTTGLEASVYAGNIISATTLVQPGSQNRLIGLSENNKVVKDQVLKNNRPSSALVKLAGSEYLASYLPVTDSDGNPVGMIAVEKPQISVLQTAGKSLEATFLLTVLLIVLSILPARIISQHIIRQIK